MFLSYDMKYKRETQDLYSMSEYEQRLGGVRKNRETKWNNYVIIHDPVVGRREYQPRPGHAHNNSVSLDELEPRNINKSLTYKICIRFCMFVSTRFYIKVGTPTVPSMAVTWLEETKQEKKMRRAL